MQPVSVEMHVRVNGEIQCTHCIEGQTENEGLTVYIGLGYLPGIDDVALPGDISVTYQGETRWPVDLIRVIDGETQILGFSF